MFPHPGFRPLWPVIFFLPWLLLGAAYILLWALHRRPVMRRIQQPEQMHRSPTRSRG
jgi:hypothetical protein